MRFFELVLAALIILVFWGCGLKTKVASKRSQGSQSEMSLMVEAGKVTYRYAFSGKVNDMLTNKPVSDFSVSLVGNDPAISMVINSMGNKNGLFHISRNPSIQDSVFSTISILISASGYESIFKTIELGADCQAGSCPGVEPIPFLISPVESGGQSTGNLGSSTPSPLYFPDVIGQVISEQGTADLFNKLVAADKLDAALQEKFLTSRNMDILNNVLIQLNGVNGFQSDDLVGLLLGSVDQAQFESLAGSLGNVTGGLIPLLAASTPEVGTALIAVNVLLPYLMPVMNQVLEKYNGPFAQVLKSLISDPNLSSNIMSLVSLLQKGGSSQQTVQMAMAAFLPMVGQILEKNMKEQNPFEKYLLQAMKEPQLYQLISSLSEGSVTKDQEIIMLVAYLQPLIQGLLGKNAPEIAYLFNQLINEGQGGGTP